MLSPNELIKTGGIDGRQVGSKVLIDSSKHMTQLARLTLETGQSLSQHGLDLNGSNVTRVNEMNVEILRAKQIIGPPIESAAPVVEFPDDMVVESVQCRAIAVTQLPNSNLLSTDAQGQLQAHQLHANSALITDASGQIISTTDLTKFVTLPSPSPSLPTFPPNSALVTDASGQIISTTDLTKFVSLPSPSFPPNSALITDASGHITSTTDLSKFVSANTIPQMAPNSNVVTDENGNMTTAALDTLVRCPVASLTNHVPRFATTNGMLASSSVYVDGEGNMSGLNKIEALRADLGEMVNTDVVQSVLSKSKTLQTEKLMLGTSFTVTSYSTNLYVSNGAFQLIGMSGEGCYICNLKIGIYSIYCSLAVGKTKTGYRTAFGPVGGVKSSQLVEYESQNGYDFLQMDLPEVGKISFGAEQKSGEFGIRSDQTELINVDIYVQRNYVATSQVLDD